ncbi:MAG: hypothetical protein C3F08_05050, partial [Candidatus Methylomirabilota bacterium]
DPSGTRTPYSLSPTGIPVFLEGGQNLVLFSGRLRVGSPMELALAAWILPSYCPIGERGQLHQETANRGTVGSALASQDHRLA